MANGCEQQWRRPTRYHGCAGFGIVLGNVADEIDAKRLAGFEWCEVRSEFKRIATGWLDFGGRRRVADVPGSAAFRRMRAGMVEHAMRLAVAKTRREYIYPAVHYASSIPASSTNYPAMGQRLRLKASVVIPSNWTTEEKAILLGLKKSLRSQHEQTWRREAVQNSDPLSLGVGTPRQFLFQASGVAV